MFRFRLHYALLKNFKEFQWTFYPRVYLIQSNLSNSNLYNSNSWVIRSFFIGPLTIIYLLHNLPNSDSWIIRFFWWSLQLPIRQVWLFFSTSAEFAVMAYRETPHWDGAWCRSWGKYDAEKTDLKKKESIILTPEVQNAKTLGHFSSPNLRFNLLWFYSGNM